MKRHQPLISDDNSLSAKQNQLSHRDLLRCGLSFAAVSALSNTTVSALARFGPSVAHPQPNPNIVFILIDNLGYHEVRCNDGGITNDNPTPRIDKLATE